MPWDFIQSIQYSLVSDPLTANFIHELPAQAFMLKTILHTIEKLIGFINKIS
jgi:hypothetical protein